MLFNIFVEAVIIFWWIQSKKTAFIWNICCNIVNTLLSLLMNVQHPCWIKVQMFFFFYNTSGYCYSGLSYFSNMHFLVEPVKILADKQQSELQVWLDQQKKTSLLLISANQLMFMKHLDDHFVVCNKVNTITDSLKWACNITPPGEPFMFTVHLWN